MQEVEMDKLVKELKDYIGNRLEDAEWYYSLFFNNELLWTNVPSLNWSSPSQDCQFRAEHKWDKKRRVFDVTLFSGMDCTIDEVHVSVIKDGQLLYSRKTKFKPIHLKKFDSFTFEIKFNIKR